MAICRHHLVTLTAGASHAVALRTATGWLLPAQDKAPDRELPEQVSDHMSRVIGQVETVHEAPLTATRNSPIDEFYFVSRINETARASTIAMVPTAELLGTPALLPIQREALAVAIARETTPSAPFDSANRVADALTWARTRAAAGTGARVITVIPHRCARHEYVARLKTESGMLCFKGGLDRVKDEGRLTQMLWTVSPNQFPCTIAVDESRAWWLYRELEGELLVESRLTLDTACAALRALAALQKRVATCHPIERHFAGRTMNASDLLMRAHEVVAVSCAGRPELLDEWLGRRQEWTDICSWVDGLGIPSTLVPSDFWGRNLLLTRDGIGFIDLENCYWSHPWLPLLRFIREVEGAVGTSSEVGEAMTNAFVSAWASHVPPETMRRALAHLPLLARLFNLLLVNHEVMLRQRELGAADGLPDWFRAAHLEPFIRRVLLSASTA